MRLPQISPLVESALRSAASSPSSTSRDLARPAQSRASSPSREYPGSTSWAGGPDLSVRSPWLPAQSHRCCCCCCQWAPGDGPPSGRSAPRRAPHEVSAPPPLRAASQLCTSRSPSRSLTGQSRSASTLGVGVGLGLWLGIGLGLGMGLGLGLELGLGLGLGLTCGAARRRAASRARGHGSRAA